MDYFGINSPADLPKIREVLAEQIVEGTMVNPEDFTDQNVAHSVAEDEEPVITGDVSDLTVNEDGELIIKEEEEEEEDKPEETGNSPE